MCGKQLDAEGSGKFILARHAGVLAAGRFQTAHMSWAFAFASSASSTTLGASLAMLLVDLV
jgi:hypothetical protein